MEVVDGLHPPTFIFTRLRLGYGNEGDLKGCERESAYECEYASDLINIVCCFASSFCIKYFRILCARVPLRGFTKLTGDSLSDAETETVDLIAGCQHMLPTYRKESS